MEGSLKKVEWLYPNRPYPFGEFDGSSHRRVRLSMAFPTYEDYTFDATIATFNNWSGWQDSNFALKNSPRIAECFFNSVILRPFGGYIFLMAKLNERTYSRYELNEMSFGIESRTLMEYLNDLKEEVVL